MTPEELVQKLTEIEVVYLSPSERFSVRCRIIASALHQEYLRGRREADDLADKLRTCGDHFHK